MHTNHNTCLWDAVKYWKLTHKKNNRRPPMHMVLQVRIWVTLTTNPQRMQHIIQTEIISVAITHISSDPRIIIKITVRRIPTDNSMPHKQLKQTISQTIVPPPQLPLTIYISLLTQTLQSLCIAHPHTNVPTRLIAREIRQTENDLWQHTDERQRRQPQVVPIIFQPSQQLRGLPLELTANL